MAVAGISSFSVETQGGTVHRTHDVHAGPRHETGQDAVSNVEHIGRQGDRGVVHPHRGAR